MLDKGRTVLVLGTKEQRKGDKWKGVLMLAPRRRAKDAIGEQCLCLLQRKGGTGEGTGGARTRPGIGNSHNVIIQKPVPTLAPLGGYVNGWLYR
jgi:hypothetical protein